MQDNYLVLHAIGCTIITLKKINGEGTQMARYSYNQTEEQSCTAAAIMVTLAELGKIASTDIDQTREMRIWEQTKRGTVQGKEEVMPHNGIDCLCSYGLHTELHENNQITAVLKHAAAADYAEYERGLQHYQITRSGAVNITTAFANDARVFLIVGFMSGQDLKTHTVLMRRDQGSLWVMNPDGGTDTQYTDAEVLQFTSGQTAPVPFAGRDYLCAGIAYRAWV